MEVLGLVDIPLWILLSVTLLVTVYLWLTRKFGYFKAQGIPGPRPWPLFGTLLDEFFKPRHPKEREYLKYGKTIGLFLFTEPALWTVDSDILKEVMVKNFVAFPNRTPTISQGFLKHMLITASGPDWHRIRRLLTPAFSGAKLKQMNTQLNKCSQQFGENLREFADTGKSLEMKEYCGAFTMDVIASIAFGLDIDSQKDVNNPFVVMAKKAFQRNSVSDILRFVPLILKITTKFGFKAFPQSTVDFFSKIVNQTIDLRKEEEMKQVDFLQLMMTAEQDVKDGLAEPNPSSGTQTCKNDNKTEEKDATPKGLSREEILANSVIFFLAGYETTATTLSLLLYNLAVHPEIQEKLHKEVQEYLSKHKRTNYSSLHELSYMEQCINESLRLFPPVPRIARMCHTDTTVHGIKIRKGMRVWIPVYAIHYNPDYYPDPDKFDPERFSPEASANRNPYHFMPFGFGPRHCIGMRLALAELKIAAVHLVKDFRFVKCDKTKIPLELTSNNLLAIKGGIWLKVENRKSH